MRLNQQITPFSGQLQTTNISPPAEINSAEIKRKKKRKEEGERKEKKGRRIKTIKFFFLFL